MLMVSVLGPEGSRKDLTGTVQCLQGGLGLDRWAADTAGQGRSGASSVV
jgi:hypothetical protein